MKLKTIKGVLTLVVIFVVIPFAALSILWKDACKTERQSELPQPDGKYVASVYLTRCEGSVLKPATEVRVDEKPIVLYQGDAAPELSWTSSPPTLHVTYPKDAKIVQRHPPDAGLTVDLVERKQ